MSIEATKWAWQQNVGSITAKLLLANLAEHADRTGRSFPSRKTLMRETELSPTAFKTAMKRLVKDKLVKTEASFTEKGRQTSNEYQLLMGGSSAARGSSRDPLQGGVRRPPPPGRLATPSGESSRDPLVSLNHQKEPPEGTHPLTPVSVSFSSKDFLSKNSTHPKLEVVVSPNGGQPAGISTLGAVGAALAEATGYTSPTAANLRYLAGPTAELEAQGATAEGIAMAMRELQLEMEPRMCTPPTLARHYGRLLRAAEMGLNGSRPSKVMRNIVALDEWGKQHDEVDGEDHGMFGVFGRSGRQSDVEAEVVEVEEVAP